MLHFGPVLWATYNRFLGQFGPNDFVSEQKKAAQKENLRETFKLFDTDGSGKISPEELKTIMLKLGEDLTDHQIREMIREADADNDGEIDFDEFVRMVSC